LPVGYRTCKSRDDFLTYGAHLWEFETLAKEIIINSPKYGKSKSLDNWNNLASAVNRLKKLEDTIAAEFSSQDNVLVELHRIAHRQFPWQSHNQKQKLIRYWKIYFALQPHFSQVYDVDLDVFITIGMLLFGSFTENFAINYPLNIKVNGISQTHIDNFLSHICMGNDELSDELKSQLRMSHEFVYAYHSLKAYPLVRFYYNSQDFITCPLPTLLFNRITDGVFYDLVNLSGFDNDFGDSFQAYVGEYLEQASNCSVLPEQIYGSRRHRRRTVDWIALDHENTALFIECKAKRLTMLAKNALDNLEDLQKDLRKLAEAVVQTYQTTLDYETGLYPQLEFVANRKVYLLIVTLEEWYLFGDKTQDLLNTEVNKIFEEKGLDKTLLKKYPYTVASAETFEALSFILSKLSIKDIFAPRSTDKERGLWHFQAYLYDLYSEQLQDFKNPLEPQFDQFIRSTVEKIKA